MVTLAGTLLIVSLNAQHPRLIFNSTELAWMKSQVEANTTRWQALKADCDALVNLPVSYPDQYGDGGPQVPRVANSGTTTSSIGIIASYAGEFYLDPVWDLGACYLATNGASGFSTTLRDQYGEKLRHIGIAASVPPGTMRKLVLSGATVRVAGGRATAISSSFSSLLTGMEILIESSGNADLDGYHEMTLEVSGTGATIGFPIRSTVPDGSYTCDISVAVRLHPLNKRVAISNITAANPAVITALTHGFTTGDSILIEGLEGPWAALNGTRTATVQGISTFSVPVSMVGAGSFIAYQYGYGTAGKLNKLAQFYIAGNSGTYLANGNTVTVSDLTGCTNVNGTRTLTIESTSQVNFGVNADQPCTNYSYSSLRDSGYSFRNYAVMLSMIYDWAYDRLSAGERQAMVDRVNLYMRESKRSEQDSTTLHPSHNYFAGFINGAVLANIAFDLVNNPDPQIAAFVNDRLYGQGYFLEFFNRWLPYGGYPQGNREYGSNAATSLYLAAIASETAGRSWTTGNYGWLGGNINYMMSFANPPLTESDYNQFTAGINSSDSGLNAPPLDEPNRINPSKTAIISYWARKIGHPDAAKMTKFHFDTKQLVRDSITAGYKPRANAQTQLGTNLSNAYAFLFEDPSATQTEWRENARLNGKGFRGHYVTTREGWADTGWQVTFDADREVDNVSQGKSRWNAGSVTVRRGRKALIDYPNALISRYGTSSQHSTYQNTVTTSAGTNTWRWDNVFFADAATSTQTGAQDYRSQCYSTTVAATGAQSRKQIQPLDSRLDRISELSALTYWRGINLECNYGRPSPINARSNVEGWTREVLTDRSTGVVVVRDATRTVNSTDTRFLSWVVPATPVLDSGTRYRINDPSGNFLGMVSVVRPTSAVITASQWSSATFINALEIAPPSGASRSIHFLTVLDPATSIGAAKTVTELSGTGGGTYVQIGTDAVVSFADGATSFSYPGTSVIHRHIFAGLTASTTHYLTNTGGTTWTINTTSGTTSFTSDANGVGVAILP